MPYFLVGRLDGKTSAGFHGFHEDVIGFIDVGGHDMFKAATGCYWETASLVGVDFVCKVCYLKKNLVRSFRNLFHGFVVCGCWFLLSGTRPFVLLFEVPFDCCLCFGKVFLGKKSVACPRQVFFENKVEDGGDTTKLNLVAVDKASFSCFVGTNRLDCHVR